MLSTLTNQIVTFGSFDLLIWEGYMPEVTWKLNNKTTFHHLQNTSQWLHLKYAIWLVKIMTQYGNTKVHKKSAWSRSVIRGYQIPYEIAKKKGLTLVRLSLHCESTQLQVIVTLFTVKSSQLQIMLTQHYKPTQLKVIVTLLTVQLCYKSLQHYSL